MAVAISEDAASQISHVPFKTDTKKGGFSLQAGRETESACQVLPRLGK